MKLSNYVPSFTQPAAYAAFFLSGLSSLIFQTIWTRMLHHVFGVSPVAISTVLTIFMAGLGLGTWLSGRVAKRIEHPIFTYAFAELGVAIWGLLIPFMVPVDGWLADVNAFLRQSLGAESGTFMLARFLCVLPILLVPTTLMGSSLPLLSQHFARHEPDPQRASSMVGSLYAINTFGAALGPFLSTFILMPTVGLSITNTVACSLNVLLAVLIFAFRKQLIGSAWGSGVPLKVLPGPADEKLPSEAAIVDKVASRAAAASADADPSPTPATEAPAAEARATEVAADEATAEQVPKVEPARVGTKKAGKKKGAGKSVAAAQTEPAAPPPDTLRTRAPDTLRGLSPRAPEARSTRAEPAEEIADQWVPPIARRMAFLAFALSGASALCAEVVWSRALSMTIGSSIYSFGLILETFLIGIASGAAAMSALLSRGRTPLTGIAITAGALTMLALVPIGLRIQLAPGDPAQAAFHDGGVWTFFAVSAFPLLLIAMIVIYMGGRQRSTDGDVRQLLTPTAMVVLLVPLTCAIMVPLYFQFGYLPKILASNVAAITVMLAIATALRTRPLLLVAVVQVLIGLATILSYYWQDDIPFGFAQLVTSIDNPRTDESELPDNVGTVQAFMFLTAALCTLPATLGMGAMFPLTMRLWTSGGESIGRDVSVVYTGNTLGAIVGSWLPGFVLLSLIGMERTLHLGIFLNMVLGLALLIAGAVEPEAERAPGASHPRAARDQARNWMIALIAPLVVIAIGTAVAFRLGPTDSYSQGGMALTGAALAILTLGLWWLLRSAERGRIDPPPPKGAGELPTWHAAVVYLLAPAIPAALAGLWIGTMHRDTPYSLAWNLTHTTLGVFRVSLAQGMMDPESWGSPDLVYYRDGLSTTVSVERWNRHFALKNNGKVDASNGEDMPTQINVATFPLLLHSRGASGLDVAIIGFGSGVSVGTTLSFPVRSVDVIELERSIPEAARFFQDVNLLDYNLPEFPFVNMDRLQIHNDDARNYLASTDRQYDVIISEPSNPWITGVSDLFTVDHFRITKRRLREGGIYCQWVQLYELSPENIKTIYRTFASQYEHVLVLAADAHSSDTVMLGSDSPLVLDLERLWQGWDTPQVGDRMTVRDQLARANLHSPFDLYSRVLLANRDEVMTYTQTESRLRQGRWHSDPASTNVGACREAECRREPARLNTDDNALIEFNAPRDLIGFERYERYLGTIYSSEWPFGSLEDHVEGFGEGEERARNLAELAMALIGNGRYEQAARYIERSTEAGQVRESAVALEVLTLLLSRENAPAVRIEPPVPGRELEAAQAERLNTGFARVRQQVERGDWSAALSAMEDIPAPLRMHSGPALRFLFGYLQYQAAEGMYTQYVAAAETLDDLVRTERDYVASHPEVYYYLARAREAESEYAEALENMRTYVETRMAATSPEAQDVAEPPAGQAPTTDAAGESDKIEHEDRG